MPSEITEKEVNAIYSGGFVNLGKLTSAYGYRLATTAGKNYSKPRVCNVCGREYELKTEAWRESDFLCFACGFDDARAKKKIPANYFGANMKDFPSFGERDVNLFLSKDLWIHGVVGTGKTHFAYAMMNLLIERGERGVSFVEFHTYARSLRGAYKSPMHLSEEQIIDGWARTPVLFVDDVFGSRHEEKPSDEENHALYELVRARYSHRLRTYYTSNYTPNELRENKGFNTRTISRIEERCEIIPLTGADKRVREAEGPAFNPSEWEGKEKK